MRNARTKNACLFSLTPVSGTQEVTTQTMLTCMRLSRITRRLPVVVHAPDSDEYFWFGWESVLRGPVWSPYLAVQTESPYLAVQTESLYCADPYGTHTVQSGRLAACGT